MSWKTSRHDYGLFTEVTEERTQYLNTRGVVNCKSTMWWRKEQKNIERTKNVDELIFIVVRVFLHNYTTLVVRFNYSLFVFERISYNIW